MKRGRPQSDQDLLHSLKYSWVNVDGMAPVDDHFPHRTGGFPLL